MTIKITNGELLNALVPGLQELAGMKTSGKIAYGVGRTLKNCDVAVAAFNDQKKVILTSAAKKGKDKEPLTEGNEYVFPNDEVKAAAVADINALITTEIDLDIYPITSSEFEALEEVNAGLYLRLGQFVTELAIVKKK